MATVIPIDQARIRFTRLPAKLQDAIFDPHEDEIVLSVAQEFQLKDEQLPALAQLVGFVMMGFVSTKDLGAEIAQRLGIEAALAEKISGKLYDRIFSFLKAEIDSAYKPQFTEDEREEVIKPKAQKQVEPTISDDALSGFRIEALSPLGNELTKKNPEAVISSGDEGAKIPTPVATDSSTFILHEESEVTPLNFDVDILRGIGEFEPVKPTTPTPSNENHTPSMPPVPVEEKNPSINTFEMPGLKKQEETALADQFSVIDFSQPTSITLDSVVPPMPEAPLKIEKTNPATLGSETSKSTPTPAMFSDVRPASGSPADFQPISFSDEGEVKKDESSTGTGMAPGSQTLMTDEKNQELIPNQEEAYARQAPSSFLGKFSSIFSGFKNLGEKPKPKKNLFLEGAPILSDSSVPPTPAAGIKTIDFVEPPVYKKPAEDSVPAQAVDQIKPADTQEFVSLPDQAPVAVPQSPTDNTLPPAPKP